ncbi:hypothetical protein DPV78_008032 [Talaromyces pinophilus]|nr:hypothetical protein DPV78_008032 [Talaromyces pinophilus]
MLAYCAGAVHLNGTIDHVVNHLLDTGCLLGVFAAVQDAAVEVAVANVSQDTGKDIQVIELLLGFFYNGQYVGHKKRMVDAPIISGSRDRGTATSVDQTSPPSGRKARLLQRDSLRADQSACAS